jgi:universal stress protein E
MSAKKILALVDPTTNEQQPVIERAAWLAEKTGAVIELFACDYDANIDAGRVATVSLPDAGARERLLLRHRGRLDQLAGPLRERGLSVTVNVAWDYPVADVLIKRAAAERPWLVAKDAQHDNLVQRTLLTNADWRLIRKCPVPLLLVKRPAIASNPVVLAAVDPLHVHDKPAALDDAIYKFAAVLSASSGGALHLVHAAAPPMGIELAPQLQALIASESRRAIAKFVETHPVAGDRVHVLDGLADVCLESAVKQHHADFLVMVCLESAVKQHPRGLPRDGRRRTAWLQKAADRQHGSASARPAAVRSRDRQTSRVGPAELNKRKRHAKMETSRFSGK